MCHWFCPLAIDWGTAADWAQVIAAIVAAGVVLYVWREQSKLTIRTHRESHRPHLSLDLETNSVDEPHVCFVLRSNGLGPAIIESIVVSYDDAPIAGSIDVVGGYCIDRMKAFSDAQETECNYHMPDPGDWMRPGDSMIIFGCTFKPSERVLSIVGENNVLLDKELSRYSVSVRYKSVYEDQDPFESSLSRSAISRSSDD